MPKKILITGATDGIGFETAKILVAQGHHVLLHGRSAQKLEDVQEALAKNGNVESFLADLSNLSETKKMADEINAKHDSLDVLINNAGVLKTPNPITANGQDIRFVVNTIAPYQLTKAFLPLMNTDSRIVNLSSAAQAMVDLDALKGKRTGLEEMDAYSQSKLAITMWSKALANSLGKNGPMVVAVNPGSLLASKMVKDGFGIEGKDILIGANILVDAALSDEFVNATGLYFDNDLGDFGPAHPDVSNTEKVAKVMEILEKMTE